MQAVFSIVGANGDEGPPVPIPNTAVKLIRAENTWRAASRENRSMPTLKRQILRNLFFIFINICNQTLAFLAFLHDFLAVCKFCFIIFLFMLQYIG